MVMTFSYPVQFCILRTPLQKVVIYRTHTHSRLISQFTASKYINGIVVRGGREVIGESKPQ